MRRYVHVHWNLIRFDLWRAWVKLTARRLCPECEGYGCIARLDAGYMTRFGLRPWDGCKACGGTREKRGAGLAGRRVLQTVEAR